MELRIENPEWRSRGWAVIAVLLVTCALSPASMAADAPDIYDKIAAANEAFEDGRFDEALGAYEEAVETLGDSHSLEYNRAAAQYKLGNFPPAAELFARAAMSPDSDISRRSRFAWGNCDYASALATLQPADPEAGEQPDFQGGLETLKSAILHYRDALAAGGDLPAGDPRDLAARENIERSQLLIKAIEEFLEQQQQQQQDQSQEDEQQDKEQQDQQEQNEDGDQQQQSEEQEQEQQDQQQKGEEQEESDEQQDEQQAAEQQQEDNQQQAEQQPGQPQESEQQQDRQMTPEEVEALLQAVRDKEQKRREEKRKEVRARRVPVTRDW